MDRPVFASFAVVFAAACTASAPIESGEVVVSSPRTDASAASFSPLRSAARPCPPSAPAEEGYPPWQIDNRFEVCISGPEGRWQVTPDKTDADGWRHKLTFEGARSDTWSLDVIAPRGLARRLDGFVVLVDLKEHVSLISPSGDVVWRVPHPRCGAVTTVAVGWDDSIWITCGYSVLRFDSRGKLLWQKWPCGDRHLRSLWVDRKGLAYVAGVDTIIALDEKGDKVWSFQVGSNRAVGKVVWTPRGTMIVDTSMNELHSDPSQTGGTRFYHEYEPNELIEITREGTLVAKTPRPELGAKTSAWPSVLTVPSDGSHRLP